MRLMAQIPIYYINLASRSDRRQAMEARFATLGLQARRIEAVTPTTIAQNDLDRYCDPRRYLWQTPTELACSLSHVNALRAFLETGGLCAAIFEDDVLLSPRLPAFLDALTVLSPLPDLVKLETFNDVMLMESHPGPNAGPIAFRKVFSRTNGSAGYVVSRMVAAQIADSVQLRMTQADTALFNPHHYLSRHLDVVHADPALCIQLHRWEPNQLDSPDSEITAARAGRRAIARRYRLHRDVRRLRELVEGWFWSAKEYWWKMRIKEKPRRIPFATDLGDDSSRTKQFG